MTDRKDRKDSNRQGGRKAPLPFFRTQEMDFLPPAEWCKAMLREFQYLCGRMGNWRHCPLPRCRRSHACTGGSDLNKRDPRFPPCICDNDRHAALCREMRVYERELQAAYHCFAEDPE